MLTTEVASSWEEDMQLHWLPFASIHCQYRVCSIDIASVKERKTLKLHKNAAQTGGTMQTSWQLGLMFTPPSYTYVCECVCTQKQTHHHQRHTQLRCH